MVRSNAEEAMVGNWKLPRETYTICNLYSAHRDPKIWTEPDKFNPERFLDENGKVVNGEKLIPFGLGKACYNFEKDLQ